MFLLYYAEAVYFFRGIKNITIMGIAMVAMLAFGGTFAYFTATATDTTSTAIKMGTVKLTNGVTSITTSLKKNIVPGAYVFGAASEYEKITLTASEDVDVWVLAKFTTYAGDKEASKIVFTSGSDSYNSNSENNKSIVKEAIKLGTDGVDTVWKKSSTEGIYGVKVLAGESVPSFEFNLMIDDGVKANFDQEANAENTHNTSANVMGVNVTVKIQFVAIQALNNDDLNIAYDNASGLFA